MVAAARAEGGSLDSIIAALAACDYERAAAIVYARASLGLDVSPSIVALIVTGLSDAETAIDLIALAGDGRGAALLDIVESRRFPHAPEYRATQIAALYAAWRDGAPRARVVRQARRLAIGDVDTISGALLVTLARELDDAELREACAMLAKDLPEAREIAADDRKSVV